MGKDFRVTVYNKDRAKEWESILGTTTVYVKSPFPTLAKLPGRGEALIYELDLDLITDEQRERLVAHLAAKFDVPLAVVQAKLDLGVPILADDCTVGVMNPQKWF